MTRRQAVLALAGSLEDLRWQPHTASGSIVRSAGAAKLVANAKGPCPACGGHEVRSRLTGEAVGLVKGPGVIRDRFRRERPCETCGGGVDDHGRVHPGRGFIRYDAMDETKMPLRTLETPTAPPRLRSHCCPFCGGNGAHGNGRRCNVCSGSGRIEWSPFELHVDEEVSDRDRERALIAAIERRDEAGSYAELDRALELLRRRDLHAWRLFRAVHVLAGLDGPRDDVVDRDALEDALALVDGWMPEPIRVPSFVVSGEKARREQLRSVRGRADRRMTRRRADEIRRLYRDEHWPVPELVRVFGVGRRQVYEILNGGEEAA